MSGTAGWAMRLLLMAGVALLPDAWAYADIIATDQAVAAQEREELVQLMQRPDIARRLEVMGVNPRLARQRVAELDDNEVHAAHARLKTLPQQGPNETLLSAFAAALMLGTTFGGRR